MENQKKTDKRIIKDDENGFEVHFKPKKQRAYVILMYGGLLLALDYILFRGLYTFGGFETLLYNPIYALKFIALKLAIIYVIYFTIYILKTNFVIKLDNEKLLNFSAPIPKLRGNKSIMTNDIENYKIGNSAVSGFVSQTTFRRIKQTYYNLRIKLKGKDEFTFFYSLSQDETHLIKRLLDKHLNL